MAKKNRGLDELYEHIWQKARSISWYLTLASIYILFSLVVFGIDLSVAMVLGIILLVHMSSWGISGIILSMNMGSIEFSRRTGIKLGISITAVSLITFTIISIATGNWLFLLVSIPPHVCGLISVFIAKRTVEE